MGMSAGIQGGRGGKAHVLKDKSTRAHGHSTMFPEKTIRVRNE